MFLGQFEHAIDAKGRLVLPAKYRHKLADGLVVTKGQERCLYIFPVDRWEQEAEKVTRLPRTDRRSRDFARAFFASADQQDLDKQGRIQLPPTLRTYAGLQKSATVLGVNERIEVWQPESWTAAEAQTDDYYADLEEAISEFGI